jgi:NADP-dependent 3-hydroxy acid dehydrogenase YdfG
MSDFGLPPAAVARAIPFAIEQPDDVEIGDITIRPTVQGSLCGGDQTKRWKRG